MGVEGLIERAVRSPAAADEAWVERREALGVDEFRHKYLVPRRPVVLVDALRDWPALRVFSHEFFRERFADLPVQVRGRSHRLAEILEQQLASTRDRPGPYPCTLAQCEALLPYVMPRFACSLPTRTGNPLVPKRVFELINHLEIFFGGPGGEFPRVHFDMLHMHAWITQVHGEKEVSLYEHGQERLLYVNPQLPWLSSVQDPRDFGRYPLLRHARVHHVVLRPGDALFVPHGTWHTARCLGLNITVAFDQLEETNWSAFVAEVVAEQRRSGRRARALLLGAYLRLLGPLLAGAERFGGHRAANWGAASRCAPSSEHA